MAHLILTGCTGNAGSAVLSYCLTAPNVGRVSILSRRPVKLAEGNPKANVIIHSDYRSYPEYILQELKGATGCIWGMGISSVGMSESDYKTIEHDYPLAGAKAFSSLGPSMNFVYVSGEGVDPEGKGSMMFSRIKGLTEKDLLAAQSEHPSLHVYNLRPGYIVRIYDRSLAVF